MYLPRADLCTATICFIALLPSTRDEICRFFKRHKNYKNNFFDNTIAALNTCRTELYLDIFLTSSYMIKNIRKPCFPLNQSFLRRTASQKTSSPKRAYGFISMETSSIATAFVTLSSSILHAARSHQSPCLMRKMAQVSA